MDSLTMDNTSLKWQDVAIPSAVVTVCALSVNTGWLKEQRYTMQDVLSAKGTHKTKIDNYLQYVPMVTVYGVDLLGYKSKHELLDKSLILAISYATMGLVVNGMKHTLKEQRPDSKAMNSFPSGHTATAFMGAEFLFQEYKHHSRWISYSGYAIAAVTGYLRIYNNRHYLNDVIAGACIGILSTKFAYWLYPKCFKKRDKSRVAVFGVPYYMDKGLGISMSLTL